MTDGIGRSATSTSSWRSAAATRSGRSKRASTRRCTSTICCPTGSSARRSARSTARSSPDPRRTTGSRRCGTSGDPDTFGLGAPGAPWLPSAMDTARRTAAAMRRRCSGAPASSARCSRRSTPWSDDRPSIFETDAARRDAGIAGRLRPAQQRRLPLHRDRGRSRDRRRRRVRQRTRCDRCAPRSRQRRAAGRLPAGRDRRPLAGRWRPVRQPPARSGPSAPRAASETVHRGRPAAAQAGAAGHIGRGGEPDAGPDLRRAIAPHDRTLASGACGRTRTSA